MAGPRHVARRLNRAFQRQSLRAVPRRAIAVPRGRPVYRNLPVRHGVFQKLERRAQSSVKLLARNFGELRFRVVNVVDVNAFELQVAEALIELMRDVSGRHAMARLNEVFPLADARLDERLFDIGDHLLAAAWRLGVKRDVAALGRDHDLVASRPGQAGERVAYATFASLAAVVRRRVEDVTAQFDRASDGASISLVGPIVGAAEVRAEAD